jgi:FMN-dependent oxidoreductase (nitrilotriacetate monooxygenase family)
MRRPGEKMRLGAFFNPTGHHVASWRHPEAQADAGINFEHYKEIALIAEQAKMDMVFIADNLSVREAHPDALARSAQYIANMEPMTLISALAAVTSRIGLVATASTSFNEPFHVARKFASIDHISGGRAGWNLVTSGTVSDAYNFSRDEHYAHDVRYNRAQEFVTVVTRLWDSWDDDAFLRNKVTGIFLDPKKMHSLNHKGNWFSVRGPLNVPRTPQGWPVIVQAGGSDDMIEVAAEFAEVIFCAPLNLDQAQKFYKKIKGRLAEHQRATESMKIMPGLSPIVGRTREEAEEKQAFLDGLTSPVVAKEILSFVLGGVDLSHYDLDDPMPEVKPTSTSGQSIINHVMDIARKGNLSLRQTAQVVAGARGKFALSGTAESIADTMEEWFMTFGCDGFNIMPPYLPGSLHDFTSLVIPELQRRGLFRKEYEGKTLRENLGLSRPETGRSRTN